MARSAFFSTSPSLSKAVVDSAMFVVNSRRPEYDSNNLSLMAWDNAKEWD
jgi:hypothetical protein